MNTTDFLSFDWQRDPRLDDSGRGLRYDKMASAHAKAGSFDEIPISPVHYAWVHKGEGSPYATRLFIYEVGCWERGKPQRLVPLGFVDCSKMRGVYDWGFRDGKRDLASLLVGNIIELYVAKALAA